MGLDQWMSRADCVSRLGLCEPGVPKGWVPVKHWGVDALLGIATGYNGAPAGEPGCLDGHCPRGLLSYDELESLSGYDSGPGTCISVHAEQNAIIYARTSCKGATAYVTGQPCNTCHKLLIAAG